jgi:glycosyltransferase involved in cell wall biosynthesis
MSRPLRVLHIVSGDLWAGAEVQAFTLMAHLKSMPDTEVAAVLMNEFTLADKLRSVGIEVYITDEHNAGALRIAFALRRVLRHWQPDVIHTHRVKENILGSLGNLACRNVPSVRTVHGRREETGETSWRSASHHLINWADRWCGCVLQQRIIAVTKELAGRLAYDFPTERIVVIENGIDFEAVILQRGIAEFRAAEPELTHVGIACRLVEVKRVDIFLETAALLLQECPDRHWRFHIFGDGPVRSRLEQLAQSLRLVGRVMFHGHREDIATCVGGLDALVICSDHEGMPMISLEASALGVPTVAHAVGGLVEVISEEFLVSRHDAFGYKDGILRALRADARAIAARHGAETVARFSARRNAERVRALYEEVVAETRSNR